MNGLLERLFRYWVYGGFLSGLMLLALMPLIAHDWSGVTTSIFLLLPIYMLHQYEEHENDRFRLYINQALGAGKEVLTPAAAFIINVPGVWGLLVADFYLASHFNPGFGLIAVYLTLINALTHMVYAVASQRYNPGLWTSIALFLPTGSYALYQIQTTGHGGWIYHAVGLTTAIAIHVAIVAYVRCRKARLTASTAD